MIFLKFFRVKWASRELPKVQAILQDRESLPSKAHLKNFQDGFRSTRFSFLRAFLKFWALSGKKAAETGVFVISKTLGKQNYPIGNLSHALLPQSLDVSLQANKLWCNFAEDQYRSRL